jgi:predicted small lipoprotein YifL
MGLRRVLPHGGATLARALASVAGLGLVLALAGCGQKGPLTLPTASSKAASSTPAAPVPGDRTSSTASRPGSGAPVPAR